MYQLIFTYFAIYFIIWWVCLFVVLPYGNTSQAEAADIVPGTEPGAPVNPRLGRKLMINSLLSLGFLAIYIIITTVFGWSLDDVTGIFPSDLKP